MREIMMNLLNDESGQGMAEYGLILALVAVIVAGALSALGDGIFGKMNEVTTEMGGTAATK